MAERIPVRKNGEPCYEILLEQDFKRLPSELEGLGLANRKLCIVTDSRVGPLYEAEVAGLLGDLAGELTVFTFPAGEEYKNLSTVQKLYQHLIEHHFERRDLLVALGGGVVGDLTGFAAATYLRGIDFIQIPTTLLSQVDSSIGGKTGVDFDAYKNMVGAFHMPRLVYINLSTLKTLEDRQFASGMGEVLKHGLIRDDGYYEWVLDHMSEIEEKDPQVLGKLVAGSCNIKRTVVEADPTEQGERALLNFGHTVGHAVEKLLDFQMLHGECVALGSVAAAYLSWERGYLSEEEFYEIRDMFVGFGLPITVEGLTDGQILETTKSDKKMVDGRVKFILLKKIGRAVIDKTVTDEELLQAIRCILVGNEEEHER